MLHELYEMVCTNQTNDPRRKSQITSRRSHTASGTEAVDYDEGGQQDSLRSQTMIRRSDPLYLPVKDDQVAVDLSYRGFKNRWRRHAPKASDSGHR